MQSELDTTDTVREVQILGVNAIGLESGNATICAGRTLPWLQDSTQVQAWQKWGATKDDVILLDSAGVVFGVYNLLSHNLATPANYAELKSMLLGAANQSVAATTRSRDPSQRAESSTKRHTAFISRM